MRRALAVAALTVLALSAIAGAGAGAGTIPLATPTVQAGINDPNVPEVAVLEFMPSELKVAVGTPVTWTWKGAIEPHSVTFVPEGTEPPNETSFGDYLTRTDPSGPYDGTTLANSGLEPLLPGADAPDFTMTFGAPGSYTYYCIIHPKMIGTVDVVDSGTGAQTAAEVRAAGKAQQRRWLAEGRAAKAKLEHARPKKSTSGGVTTWQLEMGVTTKHADVLAFAPTLAKVRAGDAVEFVNRSRAPHTATFSNGQEVITNPVAPETTTAIPGPSPQALNSTDLFNTGQLPGAYSPAPGEPVPPLSARRFTFTVPDRGRYEYYCILHIASGMAGAVVARE
jgi:plastocyanin